MKTNWIIIALLGLFTVACAGSGSSEEAITEAVDSTATEMETASEVVDTTAMEADSTALEADTTGTMN